MKKTILLLLTFLSINATASTILTLDNENNNHCVINTKHRITDVGVGEEVQVIKVTCRDEEPYYTSLEYIGTDGNIYLGFEKEGVKQIHKIVQYISE